MYYPKPLTETSIFHIQTSHHFLAFDYQSLKLMGLRTIQDPLPEKEAVGSGLDFLPLTGEDAVNLLSCQVEYQGTDYKLSKGTSKPSDCQLIESGKFFQHRAIHGIGFEDGAPSGEIILEISSWPDRINLELKYDPDLSLSEGTLSMTLKIPQMYTDSLREESGNLLATNTQGEGFLLFAPGPVTASVLDSSGFTVKMDMDGSDNYSLRLALIPVHTSDTGSIASLLSVEKGSTSVSCTQISPFTNGIQTYYDSLRGKYTVNLRNDDGSLDRIERVTMEIENPTVSDRSIRLMFNKTKVTGITGISAMFRDSDGHPTGIPIQISKNWHNQDPDNRYNGPWFHGFSMLTIPANTTVNLEFTLVNGYWGSLPAASHNQLSLVGWVGGWGDNQLWEESAIGAWGETACYEPDGGQAQTMVCDVRPLMIESTDPAISRPQRYNWTPNVGGADFFRFYNESGQKEFITRIKTHHKRICPNLTEVTYAGKTSGYEADYSLTSSIYRTDDYVRIIYRIKLTVNEPVEFTRLAIAQVGAESYSYTGERKFAFGDENGLIEEWNTNWGGSTYRKSGLQTDGALPWISMHDAVNRNPSEWGAWANRGLVVRRWKAVIGGASSKPYFSEYGAVARGTATSLVEINPAPGVTQLLPGDYIEAEIVEVVVPQEMESYYGPNEPFRKALEAGEDTWKMVYREAVKNNITPIVAVGTVVDTFPIVVQVNASNEAEVGFEGGLGYQPVTFTGLTSYKDFDIRLIKGGSKIFLSDQEVHGKDYWQTDYDPVSETWDITFSVPMDTAAEVGLGQEFILYNDFYDDQYIPWIQTGLLDFTDSVDNPAVTTLNPSVKVGKAVREEGLWSYVSFQFPDYLDLSTYSTFRIKTYYEGTEPLPNPCYVQFILRNNGEGSTQYSLIKNVMSANTWREMVFDCPDAHGRDTYNQIWFFFSSPDTSGAATGQVFYLDDLMGPPLTISRENIEIYTSAGGDSVTLDLSGAKDRLQSVSNPGFTLMKNGNTSLTVIKTDYDSSKIYLVLGMDDQLDGRDIITLSFTSGEIKDKTGRILSWFEDEPVYNNTRSIYNVELITRDLETGNPLADVQVSVDTNILSTSPQGRATLDLEPGIYNFLFTLEDYFSIDTTFTIDSDTSITMELKESRADVKFRILDAGSPLNNAAVTLNGISKETNTVGIVVFDTLFVYQDYP